MHAGLVAALNSLMANQPTNTNCNLGINVYFSVGYSFTLASACYSNQTWIFIMAGGYCTLLDKNSFPTSSHNIIMTESSKTTHSSFLVRANRWFRHSASGWRHELLHMLRTVSGNCLVVKYGEDNSRTKLLVPVYISPLVIRDSQCIKTWTTWRIWLLNYEAQRKWIV